MCTAGGNDRVEVLVRAPLPCRDVPGMRTCSAASPACPVLQGVELLETRLLPAARRVEFRFRARDAESVRMVLRRAGIDYDSLWTVTTAR